MNALRSICTPFDEEEICSLRAGDRVELTGTVLTARDAAHERFLRARAAGEPLPVDLSGRLIFYAGPAPTPPGRIIGSVAPTTAVRMDGYLELLYQCGAAGTIGKGGRSEAATELCRVYKRVYFLSPGGIAALTSRHIRRCAEIAYPELGAESVKELEVENLRLIVGIDSLGTMFDRAEIARYRYPPSRPEF